MKVALYCRVSTDEQARTGESILDQRQALERWAREHCHQVAGVYEDEGFSAHKSFKSRPQLHRLLDDVQAGVIDLIAFTKFDRWTRKAADYYALQEILDRARVPWAAILEDYETVTADGRFKVGIMLSVNQHEAERTSERIKFTFAEKRRRGELISGNMPKGYRIQDGKPVKDPETEAGMTAFWRTYLSGAGMKAAILAADARGVRISASSGSFILRNAKHYSGAIQGVSCDPYITQEDVERVLASRKARRKGSGEVYLFNGILFCGDCGGAMGAHRNVYKRKSGDAVQIFYNCGKRYRTLGRECVNCVNIYERDIENTLLEGLSDAIEQAAKRKEIEIIERKAARDKAADTERIRSALEARKRRAWDAYLGGVAELQDYQKELKLITAELEKLEPVPELDESAPRRIREALPQNWLELYRQMDRRHKSQFWSKMIERIEVTPERQVHFLLRQSII